MLSVKTGQSVDNTMTPKVIALVLVVWFLTVAIAGHAGLLIGSPAFVPGGYVVLTTLILCTLALTVKPLRAWLLSLNLRFIVLMHFVRFAGIAFLVSSQSNNGLPALFANRAGYGDIFAAITALALAAGFLPAVNRFRRRLLLVWNVIGILDLFLAVGTGVSIQLSGSEAMAPIVTAPLMYVPFYFVPLLLITHLLIFYRLAVGTVNAEGQF